MSESGYFKTLAIIPAFRDSSSLLEVLSRFNEKMVDEICVVLDCADNDEVGKVQELSVNICVPIHIIVNERRNGVGHAIKQGLKHALDNGYDIVVVLAGNNKDDPAEIPRLIEPIVKEGYDYVQGSRFLPGGKRIRNPFFRGAFSRFYPLFWTLLTNVRCTDVTNGFRAYKLKILDDSRINIWQDWLDSYEFEYYIHYKALTLGYKTKEVPVSKTYSHRHKGGYSHISPLRDWWKIVGPLIYLKLGVRK